MGPTGVPDTKINWPTDCRAQIQLQLNFSEVMVRLRLAGPRPAL
jgi:hypothetical protein